MCFGSISYIHSSDCLQDLLQCVSSTTVSCYWNVYNILEVTVLKQGSHIIKYIFLMVIVMMENRIEYQFLKCYIYLAHNSIGRRKLAFKSKSCHSPIFWRWETLSAIEKFNAPRLNCQNISFSWKFLSLQRKVSNIVQSVHSQVVLLSQN